MTGWCLGVDLGTSFSAAAIAVDGRVELLDIGGDRRIPSGVVLDDSGQLLAGVVAQRMMGRAPDRAERNPKRNVGRGPMLLGGTPVTTEAALAAVLSILVGEARRRFDGADPDRLVLTHPVAWTAAQQDVLRAAAARVVPAAAVTMLAEPVAAALHYAHEMRLVDGDTVAVYDLGGGTFDAAVLAARGGTFQIVGRPGGDAEIGGESFDVRVFDHFGHHLERLAPDWWERVRSGTDRRSLAASAALLAEARRAKESLSDYESASQYVQEADADVDITRAELDALIGGDVERSVKILNETITSAGCRPDDLRGIFLTGGASRTVCVQESLRAVHGARIRTWQDPKTAVALGAARSVLLPARPLDDADEDGDEDTGPVDVVADGVLQAVSDGRSLRLWALDDAQPATRHRLLRFDVGTGRIERNLAMGPIVGWAASDLLTLVAERRGESIVLHALDPEMLIRSTVELESPRSDPLLTVAGPHGWAFLRGKDAAEVDNTGGLPWGETGRLWVRPMGLNPAFSPGMNREHDLGPAAFWFVNEDAASRRLLDLSGPTSALPGAFGGDHATIAMGRYRTRFRVRGTGDFVPSQVLVSVGPDGQVVQLTEQSGRPGVPWIHQVLKPADIWFLATSEGLETFADLRRGLNRLQFLARPPAGVARWVQAGGLMYGMSLDRVVPNRGLSLYVLTRSGVRRHLGSYPGLLGNLASVRVAEQPCVRADGDALLVGVDDGRGGSQVVRADEDGATVVASGRGWMEPIGRIGGALFVLHAPEAEPGDARTAAGRVLRFRI